jgi:hypothetical protein
MHCKSQVFDNKDFCSDKCKKEFEEDKTFFLQDLINTAREMGISKRELLEDYYFDEFIILADRFVKKRKKFDEQPKEKVEEVGWDQMGI